MQRKSERKASTSKARSSSWPPDKRQLRELVKDAIIDADNDSEQRTGLFTMIEEHLSLPFETEILGVTVSVERVNLTLAEEIVAICHRGGKRQSIPILDLPLPNARPDGAEWIEAYRYWVHGA